MKELDNHTTIVSRYREWLMLWVLGPAIGYLLSWSTGFAMILFFPLIMGVFHYIALYKSSDSTHKVGLLLYALLSSVGTFVALAKSLDPLLLLRLTTIFYISQCFAEFIFPFVYKRWQFGYWTLGNLLALSYWFLYRSLTLLPDTFWHLSHTFYIYPLIALIPNAITGYFLNLAIHPNDRQTA